MILLMIRLGYQKPLFLAYTYCSFIRIPALGHYIQAITNKAIYGCSTSNGSQ